VRFLFSANPGHPLQPIEECASGGEQSRIFFALKSVMAKKEERSCLVLDEIDSNVGGVAASILGQKLKSLGEERQLICITHFVQAAEHAAHHFRVEKSSSASNAITTVRPLTSDERQIEYSRMMGKQHNIERIS
jgi:DNA repair protein RecN (Recombination protein N)